MFCKNCGAEIQNPENKYCPNCGALLENQEEITEVVNEEIVQNTNGIAVAGFILAFFVPILGIIFGSIGLKNCKKGAPRKGLALAAIIVAIAMWAINILLINVIAPYFEELLEELLEELNNF